MTDPNLITTTAEFNRFVGDVCIDDDQWETGEYVLTHTDAKRAIDSLRAALTLIADDAQTDTNCRDAAEKLLGDSVHGNSDAIPPLEEIVEQLVQRAEQAEAERENLKDKIERFGNTDDPSAFDWNVLGHIDELEQQLAAHRKLAEVLEKWWRDCEGAKDGLGIDEINRHISNVFDAFSELSTDKAITELRRLRELAEAVGAWINRPRADLQRLEIKAIETAYDELKQEQQQ